MPRRQNLFYVGLDPGKRSDYCGLAIVEAATEYNYENHRFELQFNVSELKRFPLGTPYIFIVEFVVKMLKDASLVGSGEPELAGPTLVMDVTGVGEPVMEQFRLKGVNPICLNYVGGNVVKDLGAGRYNVPRVDLQGCLQIVFEKHIIKFAPGLELQQAVETELKNLDDARKPTVKETDLILTREKENDDLVFALAGPIWYYGRDFRVELFPPTGSTTSPSDDELREKDEKFARDYDPLGRR